jgi:hypothetical protein
VAEPNRRGCVKRPFRLSGACRPQYPLPEPLPQRHEPEGHTLATHSLVGGRSIVDEAEVALVLTNLIEVATDWARLVESEFGPNAISDDKWQWVTRAEALLAAAQAKGTSADPSGS